MSLKMGIVGLPNVGKSTLFNAITNSTVEAANYPFSTIKLNMGIVAVNDERLKILEKYFHPKKLTPTTFQFLDIAGLIAGASKGEGLGNAFLANIRETDAICQVIRCFENKDITHVNGSIDSIRDVEIINLELIISDLLSVEKQLQKINKKLKNLNDKTEKFRFELLKTIQNHLENNLLLNQCEFSAEEILVIKEFNLLTIKPFIYVANIAESDLVSKSKNIHLENLKTYAKKQNITVIELCAEFEVQVSKMDNETKELFMQEYNVQSSGLDKLVLESYKLLGLQTFFTAGEDEVKAWTFTKGLLAPQCAGIIHTDFERGFIKVEIYTIDDLVKYQSDKKLKENGKIRLEGKKYQMQDGDVCYFKFNV